MRFIDACVSAQIQCVQRMTTPTQPPTPQRRTDEAQRAQRWDLAAQIPADLGPASRTAQGYLRAHAAIAVPGVMEYQDAAGNITRELIPPEELHNVDSLKSLAGLPVTLGHPDVDVDPDNVGDLGVGSMGNDVEILEESGHVRVLLVLHRRDALAAVDNGTVEVSPGYTTIIDPTPGEHPVYGRYDAIQRGRRYNHLAVVDMARGGETVRLRADSDDRRATRRHDAATAGQPSRRFRLDTAAPPTSPPAPAPAPGGFVHPFLITLAALCALPYTSRADGQVVSKTDMEGEPISEGDLISAIAAAIEQYKSQAASNDMEPAEGELSTEEMKAKIAELEGQLAAMQQDKADMEAAAAEEQDKADCAELDALADRLGVDRTAWTAETKADGRRLAIAKHKKLVDADAVIRSDAAPTGVDPSALGGMIKTLAALNPSAQARGDQWEPFTPPAKKNDGGKGGWGGPTGGNDEAPPADPLKARIKARNDERLKRSR